NDVASLVRRTAHPQRRGGVGVRVIVRLCRELLPSVGCFVPRVRCWTQAVGIVEITLHIKRDFLDLLEYVVRISHADEGLRRRAPVRGLPGGGDADRSCTNGLFERPDIDLQVGDLIEVYRFKVDAPESATKHYAPRSYSISGVLIDKHQA